MSKRSKILLLCALITGIVAMLSLAYAEEAKQPEARELPSLLKETLEQNLEACGRENLQMAMRGIHSKSPVYEQSRQASTRIFQLYDLRYEMLSFGYIGTDGEYSVARVKQKTTKIKGPAFRDNIVDTMQIFRKEVNQWKVWQTTVLEVKYIQPTTSAVR